MRTIEDKQCFCEIDERRMLLKFWKSLDEAEAAVNEYGLGPVVITGYNLAFDIRFLLARSHFHNIPHHNGFKTQDLMTAAEKLEAACARYGIKHCSELRGSDMPACFERGEWSRIAMHCLDDIEVEWQLLMARKAGEKAGDKNSLNLSKSQEF